MKTDACKHYSRDFWIFLPNMVKIDRYNFELYRFKVGSFLRHNVEEVTTISVFQLCKHSSHSLRWVGLLVLCAKNWQHATHLQSCRILHSPRTEFYSFISSRLSFLQSPCLYPQISADSAGSLVIHAPPCRLSSRVCLPETQQAIGRNREIFIRLLYLAPRQVLIL